MNLLDLNDVWMFMLMGVVLGVALTTIMSKGREEVQRQQIGPTIPKPKITGNIGQRPVSKNWDLMQLAIQRDAEVTDLLVRNVCVPRTTPGPVKSDEESIATLHLSGFIDDSQRAEMKSYLNLPTQAAQKLPHELESAHIVRKTIHRRKNRSARSMASNELHIWME